MTGSPVTIGRAEGSRGCAAPSTSLRFAPDGRVNACCINNQFTLGRIGTDDIADIWAGAQRQQLQQALDAGDYSLGCWSCEAPHRAGHRDWTEAAAFDRYADGDLAWPARLEFAITNTCNLQCLTCNGELSSAIRAQREHRPPLRSPYDDAFFEQLAPFLAHARSTLFLGGEPFLSRSCRRVWDLLLELPAERRPTVSVTTNGTVWDERVERYVDALAMDVCVSIDGATAATFEHLRPGARFDEVRANLDRFADVLARSGRAPSINHCYQRANWHELDALLLDAEARGMLVFLIPITYPAPFALASLAAAELEAIVRWFADREEVAARLERNRPAWEQARAVATSALAAAVAAKGATVADRPSDRFDELVADLPGEPAHLEATDDVVRSVRAPAWAAAYGLDALAGTSLLRLLPALGDHVGAVASAAITELEPGLTEVRVELAAPDGEVVGRLRAVVTEWTDADGRHQRAALVPAGGQGS